jgi:hypothetical protein
MGAALGWAPDELQRMTVPYFGWTVVVFENMVVVVVVVVAVSDWHYWAYWYIQSGVFVVDVVEAGIQMALDHMGLLPQQPPLQPNIAARHMFHMEVVVQMEDSNHHPDSTVAVVAAG